MYVPLKLTKIFHVINVSKCLLDFFLIYFLFWCIYTWCLIQFLSAKWLTATDIRPWDNIELLKSFKCPILFSNKKRFTQNVPCWDLLHTACSLRKHWLVIRGMGRRRKYSFSTPATTLMSGTAFSVRFTRFPSVGILVYHLHISFSFKSKKFYSHLLYYVYLFFP